MPERVRGEFVLVVQPADESPDRKAAESERVLALLLPELPLKKAVALAAQISGARKNALYQRALEMERDRKP
jgi:16S rRNA (cytidine1402-2'-O)-methyltransferase